MCVFCVFCCLCAEEGRGGVERGGRGVGVYTRMLCLSCQSITDHFHGLRHLASRKFKLKIASFGAVRNVSTSD